MKTPVTRDNIRLMGRMSSNNASRLLNSDKTCHCYHCLHSFPAHFVESWTDQKKTALCPRCDIDSVVTDTENFTVSKELLEAAYHYYFEPSD